MASVLKQIVIGCLLVQSTVHLSLHAMLKEDAQIIAGASITNFLDGEKELYYECREMLESVEIPNQCMSAIDLLKENNLIERLNDVDKKGNSLKNNLPEWLLPKLLSYVQYKMKFPNQPAEKKLDPDEMRNLLGELMENNLNTITIYFNFFEDHFPACVLEHYGSFEKFIALRQPEPQIELATDSEIDPYTP